MNQLSIDLEPAQRDPRALRRTAWILVGLMAVGGVLVLLAYQKMVARQGGEFRPAFTARVTRNLKVARQDGSIASLLDLRGHVWVVAAVSLEQPDTWRRSREVLVRLHERYRGRDDFHLVCLAVDPADDSPARLAACAGEVGARLPEWWFATAGGEFVHKYLKNVLKHDEFPHRDEGGGWRYDKALVVVDRDLHLRRVKVPFDFEAAAEWDRQGRTEGIERSNVEELEAQLVRTIDFLLAAKAQPT